ncbi:MULTISPECIES: response regulator transcription factor [Enterobacterales]|uniref:response regulator transcription factor n=1 Tax=Enterobacterales TaxID=91347 RepID=UPI002EDB72E4
MDDKKLKFFIYSVNKFMQYAVQEILRRNFDCVICSDMPEGSDEKVIFESNEFDVVLFDSYLLFDTGLRKILTERKELKTVALVNGEVDYGLRQIIGDYSDGMIDNTYDVDLIIMIMNAVIKGFQCLPQCRSNETHFIAQLSSLTNREQEVLHFVSQGVSNKAIADFLGVSYKTVCVHRYNIMFKLKINDLSEFNRYKTLKASK